MAGFTASWVHGSAVVVEQQSGINDGLFSFVHYGWGTQISVRPGSSFWFHIPIPSPVILDGHRMKLSRVFIQWQQTQGYRHSGYIQDVHLYDGQQKIAAQSARDFKERPAAMIPGHTTYELYQPRASFLLSSQEYKDGHFIEFHEAPLFVIGSAGADFDPI
jgi:hypothetical protein